jgi:hypothetical protein
MNLCINHEFCTAPVKVRCGESNRLSANAPPLLSLTQAVIAGIEILQRTLLPHRGVLSFRSEAPTATSIQDLGLEHQDWTAGARRGLISAFESSKRQLQPLEDAYLERATMSVHWRVARERRPAA